jgi:hypothetical protein
MKQFANLTGRAAMRFWWALRQIFGDAAYENYLRSARRGAHRDETQHGESAALLSPREFYLDSLRRKYSRTNRCC